MQVSCFLSMSQQIRLNNCHVASLIPSPPKLSMPCLSALTYLGWVLLRRGSYTAVNVGQWRWNGYLPPLPMICCSASLAGRKLPLRIPTALVLSRWQTSNPVPLNPGSGSDWRWLCSWFDQDLASDPLSLGFTNSVFNSLLSRQGEKLINKLESKLSNHDETDS